MNREVDMADALDELAPIRDYVGDEAFTARHEQLTTLKMLTCVLAGLLAVTTFVIWHLAYRPEVTRFIRIDAVHQAAEIKYDSLSFTPEDGDIMHYLSEWAVMRWTRQRSTVVKDYEKSYRFIDEPYARDLMQRDLKSHEIADVATGNQPENEVTNVDVQPISKWTQTLTGHTIYGGTSIVQFDKVFEESAVDGEKVQHWKASISYYINPWDVLAKEKRWPGYRYLNPLGFVITEIHAEAVK